MAYIVIDCFRCGAKSMTFDVLATVTTQKYPKKTLIELCCKCRSCHLPSIYLFEIKEIALESFFADQTWLQRRPDDVSSLLKLIHLITAKEFIKISIPEYLPPEIENLFREGATCLNINCYNAAGTMFRLCLDQATKLCLPDSKDITHPQPNPQQRKVLYERLKWLFENELLSKMLESHAECVRLDGNDGAHEGNLSKAEAEDLQDFTFELLEHLFTVKERLRLAEERRIARRAGQ